MNLTKRQTTTGTSLFDGDLEICQFTTGNRNLNEHYAEKILSALDSPMIKVHSNVNDSTIIK